MANTTIQILRSYANTSPSSLEDGEMAFSFLSNTLYIGSRDSQIVPIGGSGYIANATISLIDGGEFS
jgi:hypothetical protein